MAVLVLGMAAFGLQDASGNIESETRAVQQAGEPARLQEATGLSESDRRTSETLPPPQPASGTEAAESAAAPAQENQASCKMDMKELQQDYDRDVRKERNDLDSTLKFPQVGSVIGSQYVGEYNKKVADLYASYQQKARAGGCQPQADAPAMLPETYPY